MSKKVKIVANIEMREPNQPIKLWGVPFVCEGNKYVAEIDEALAKQMVDNERAILAPDQPAKAPVKAPAANNGNKPNFASDEAGELYAKLVADKKLTAQEFKKIDGSGEDGEAITVGDIEGYLAGKEAEAAAKKAAKEAKKVEPPAPTKAK